MAAGASSLGPIVLIVRKQRAEGSRAGPQNLKALSQWLAFSIGSTFIPFRNSANWGPRVQTHGAVATTSHPSRHSWYCCLPTITNATYPRDQVAGLVKWQLCPPSLSYWNWALVVPPHEKLEYICNECENDSSHSWYSVHADTHLMDYKRQQSPRWNSVERIIRNWLAEFSESGGSFPLSDLYSRPCDLWLLASCLCRSKFTPQTLPLSEFWIIS